MPNRLRALVARYLPTGSVLLSVLFFGSYLMGLLRDGIFARTFGASAALDAYQQAFILPELVFDVLVESGLAAAFIPIFLRLRGGRGDRAADDFARTILTAGVAIMGIVSLLLLVFADATTAWIAPGFEGGQRDLYVGLFRVMLVTPVLFAASLTLGQLLLVEQRMVWYGIAPLLYNGGIIAGTVVFDGSLGIYGAAIGAVIGAVLHLGSRLAGLWRSRFRIGPGWKVRTAAIREFVRLMLPKMVSQPVESTTFLVFGAMATFMAEGSVVSLNFARNFQSPPVTVIGVAFALAAFPALSAAYAQRDRRRFLRLFGTNLLSIVVLTTAAAIVVAAAGKLVIGIFLGGGAFDADDVSRTALVLAVFSIAIPFESATHLLSRAIYATRHTLLQVLGSLTSLGVTLVAAWALAPSLEIVAIPVGFAIGMGLKVVLLAAALAWRLRVWAPPGLSARTESSG